MIKKYFILKLCIHLASSNIMAVLLLTLSTTPYRHAYSIRTIILAVQTIIELPANFARRDHHLKDDTDLSLLIEFDEHSKIRLNA
jgi:hypothetical protein